MQEELFEEQPSSEQAEVANATEVKSADSEEGSSTENGFGKFKSAEALLDAYKALEAEFTRKSQRLSELEKEKTQQVIPDEQTIDSELASFLSKHSEAEKYADQLKQLSLAGGGKSNFDEIWAKFLIDKLNTNESKLENPIVKNYVINDEELKNYVVQNYMRQLTSKNPPLIISGDSGEKVTGQKPVTPSSLKDAKKLVEQMFS